MPSSLSGRFGSLAVVRRNITPMAAFGRIADIKRPTGGHKKTRHMAGLSVFLVAGARLSNYMQIEIEPFPLVA